jgi:Fe-Mn family superoxide dismutase
MFTWTRRQVLQAAGAGAAALVLAPLSAFAQKGKGTAYTLPKLPYATDALEPYIDKMTMQIHHGKHHLAYITNANNVLKKYPKLQAFSVDELLATIKKLPEAELPAKDRQALINNAGGHSNHSIFWEIMGPHKGKAVPRPTGSLAKAIAKQFGGFDKFQKQFSEAGTTLFGSGWAWLVADGNDLKIIQRHNQDSPIMDGLKPLLGLDVWEHAYYLKYQNLRPKYIEAWWHVVNWKAVAERLAKK